MSNLAEGRDPAKRKVKPAGDGLGFSIAFDLPEGESSDDSDFRIEDHPEESDDYSVDTDEEGKNDGKSDSSKDDSESDGDVYKPNKTGQTNSIADLLERAKNNEFQYPGDLSSVLICAGCLGSRSDDYNEIVECDGCGVTVHEGCYGVSDVTSESSTVSSASTEPWFCEACKAGVKEPECELCPNLGGIFKETEVGAWVHLVCALYVPGVAFSDVERLSGVTLFEMAYSRWGARACSLCRDATLARTGVAVGCDAGLCKTFFHVTCGQREGLLAEAHTEEVEQADPFYAHCKLHSDKTLIKKRKRNWLALQIRAEIRKRELQEKLSVEEKKRIERKLVKYRRKYLQMKENRNPPWVPTQKMARMLYSSASLMRKFQHKAELMGVDLHALEFQESQMAALKEVSRRWHVPPAFSVEFVGYYLERNNRMTSLRQSLERLTKENEQLLGGEGKLRTDYDEASKENTKALADLKSTQESVKKIYDFITALCPNKTAPEIVLDRPLLPLEIPRSTPKVTPQLLQQKRGAASRAISVPTAAALKMGVGFPLSDHPDARHGKVLSTSAEASSVMDVVCAVCARSSDRQLMAACDTCRRHYHLHCLTPPLQRPPKKTKLYGWQCSECDKSSESEPEVIEKKVPRRSRIRYSKDGAILTEPQSPNTSLESPPPKRKIPQAKIVNDIPNAPENHQPIKVTIKPFEFTSEDAGKKEKKMKKRQKTLSGGELSDSSSKKHLKRSFTSPTLTNTPLMSITPIVADSPSDSHNENSNHSTNIAQGKEESSFLTPNSTFSSLLSEKQEKKERDSKTIESSIETTLANLSSDIATYKANRKRRKEKHRSRYSPDLLRTPKHKHKRKKKMQDMENPGPHPRITIKIKPIPKPDGSLDTQMFYVPTDSNDGMPPAFVKKITKVTEEAIPSPVAVADASAVAAPPPQEVDAHKKAVPIPQVIIKPLDKPTPKVERASRGRRSDVTPKKAATDNLPPMTQCDVCTEPGDQTNLVRCDECFKRYHFTCLEPPLNKNPKKRGYSWHCADCDPTDNEAGH